MRAMAWEWGKIHRAAVISFLLMAFLLFPVQVHAAETEADSLTIQTTVSGYSGMAQDGTAKVTIPDGTVITADGSALEDGLLLVVEPVTESDAADVYTWISSTLQDKGSDLTAYDIYFVDSTGSRCDAAGETTIAITLSTAYENPSVYRVAADGTAAQMETEVENGVISFVMDGNGYYALLESPEDTSGSSSDAGSSDTDSASGSETTTAETGSSVSTAAAQTGDNRNLWLWEFLVLLMGFGMASAVYRRKHADK
ncbi:MAG: hypothetical protein LUF32_03675 [Clostridiales bacterium]|nr:hypothetical protein [Clostridiales bacterium]